MTKQRTCANDIAKPETLSASIAAQIDTVEHRIATFAKWFEIDPPNIEYDPDDPEGGPLLTDELFEWIKAEGASFDWVFVGDPKGMAIAYRKSQMGFNNLMKSFDRLDKTEQKIFTLGIGVHVNEMLPFDQALELIDGEIQAHRATLAGAKQLAGTQT